MIKTENIKAFVRQTLGCACPEEVFKRIDCQSNIKLNDNINLRYNLKNIFSYNYASQ